MLESKWKFQKNIKIPKVAIHQIDEMFYDFWRKVYI